MPELGEVALFSKIINDAGKNFTFNSILNFSPKNPDIPVKWHEFGIRSECRGKELAIILFGLGGVGAEDIRVLVHFSLTGEYSTVKSCYNQVRYNELSGYTEVIVGPHVHM